MNAYEKYIDIRKSKKIIFATVIYFILSLLAYGVCSNIPRLYAGVDQIIYPGIFRVFELLLFWWMILNILMSISIFILNILLLRIIVITSIIYNFIMLTIVIRGGYIDRLDMMALDVFEENLLTAAVFLLSIAIFFMLKREENG